MGTMTKDKKPAGKGKAANPWPKRIRNLQVKLGLESHRELADRLGVTIDTLRTWLYRGKIPSTMAQKFIEELLKNN